MTDHVQVIALRPILVDKDMAPLLERCWALGFDTNYSCQGERGMPAGPGPAVGSGYIAFEWAADCRAFARLVRNHHGKRLPRWLLKLDGRCVRFACDIIPLMIAALDSELRRRREAAE